MTFKSINSYLVFVDEKKTASRYIHTEDAEAFLREVLLSAKGRKRTVQKGARLWRAQKHKPNDTRNNWEIIKQDDEELYREPLPYCPKDMKPLCNCESGVRANPEGISYLYLATDTETAMA